MPTYVYSCSKCDAEQDEYRSVARRNDPVACNQCGGKMDKIISPHTAIGDLEPYYDENLEAHVKSRKHRERVMREKEVYEYFGKGWR